MHFLLAAVVCSVIVSIILKVARRQQIFIEQAIAVNYLMAFGLTIFWFQPTMPTDWKALPWTIFLPLGILLPVVFIIMSKTVEHVGIVKSDAAQRLSIIIPLVASVVIFNEQVAQHKLLGVIMAFIALLCLLVKPKTTEGEMGAGGFFTALFLISVFVGYGVIDVLFKQLSKGDFIPGLVFCFGFGFFFMVLFVFLCYQSWTLKSILGGLVLGVFNFMNIIFYLKAHKYFATSPSVVFAGMNVGVIALGTITGLVIFKEKIKVINIVGIVIAVGAIYIMSDYGKTFVDAYLPFVKEYLTIASISSVK